MMWFMMTGCLLLPLALLLFGRGTGPSVGWGWFALIGAFILIHVLMMFGHGHNESDEDTQDPTSLEASAKPQTNEHH